jgi:HK97 family phage major capsid protein
MFVMNRKTQSMIRKLKERRRQLSLNVARAGRRPRRADELPVIEAEDMPDIAADSFSVAMATSIAAI